MRKMLTLLAAVLALSAMAGIAGAYEMRTPGGIIGSFLYTKWFFSPQQSTSQHLIFRMFGHEGGLARNLFVLNCKKDKDDPAYVEMIPPSALEDKLQATGPANEKPTTIKFTNRQFAVLYKGTYDNIAAFVDMDMGNLLTFLKFFQNSEDKVTVRWNQANIEYVLVITTRRCRSSRRPTGRRSWRRVTRRCRGSRCTASA
jgi:hypothetical protein